MNRSKKAAVVFGVSLILAACGGGSNGDGTRIDGDQITGGGGGADLVGSGSLSECITPVLFQDGTVFATVHDFELDGGGIVTGTTMTSVTTNIELNGTLYTRWVRNISSENSFNSDVSESQITHFFLVDFENNFIDEGVRILVDFDETGAISNRTTEIFTPPTRVRLDMGPGEVETHSYEVDRTFETFESGSVPRNEVEVATSTDRFVGIESTSLPVGSVDACRVQSENTEGGDTEVGTFWFHEGSGINVLSRVDGVGDRSITSAAINDAAVF